MQVPKYTLWAIIQEINPIYTIRVISFRLQITTSTQSNFCAKPDWLLTSYSERLQITTSTQFNFCAKPDWLLTSYSENHFKIQANVF